MGLFDAVPRRCVNLPPGSLFKLIGSVLTNSVRTGPALNIFHQEFGKWLGVAHVCGTSSGRTAFQLALEALDLEKGAEIIFPTFTFPVMPMVAKLLGYHPVFCAVDPDSFNAGPEHITPMITEKTRAVLATHLFGQPCPIREIKTLAKEKSILLIEDCAHACGVRINGKQVGTFGDIGVFSFAEGKNMPCFGGGAIVTADDKIARRARDMISGAPIPDTKAVTRKAVSIWLKWLLTRPAVFSVTAYPALRLKLLRGHDLMDSTVGNELIEVFTNSDPQIRQMANLQAAIAMLQLKHIDGFNAGARRNAKILTEGLQDVPNIKAPYPFDKNHIYVYYPLTVSAEKRDGLRKYLLKRGIDSKISDMSDCSRLRPFAAASSLSSNQQNGPREASLLEICVYPIISEDRVRRIAAAIRSWGDLSQS
jgi:dTDP-4-amino-4,6-dideoxygalactose transaminase